MNALGIDYGEKRIGLAYGDDIGVAVALDAAVESLPAERLDHIARVIAQRRIGQIVIGYPYNMDGTVGFKAREVDAFIRQLEARFHLPVQRVDETLSSDVAEKRLGKPRGGRGDQRRQRATGAVDSAAAASILQDWLDAVCGLPPPPEE